MNNLTDSGSLSDGGGNFSWVGVDGVAGVTQDVRYLAAGEYDGDARGDSYRNWLTDDLADQLRREFFRHQETPTATLVALYCVTFLLGLVGNSLVIFVFARNRKMRTVTNSFLVNLAVCDLMVVGMCMPFSVAFEIYSNWIYGDAMCKIVNFSQGLSVSSSILTLAVISAERFYAIRSPLKARAFMSRTRIQTIICTIWFVAALAVLPSLFVRKEHVVERILTFTMSICVEQWSTPLLKHVYNFVLLIMLYMGPVIFICVGYLQIGLNLWRTNSSLHASTTAAESENARANQSGRRRVARMLFVMAILFAISWLPIHVISIVLDFLNEELQKQGQGWVLHHIHTYALWLGHANSSINPICYCIMSSSFKSALRLEFRRCCCGKVDFNRDSFMSLSMSMTVTSSNSGSGTRGVSTRVLYRPIANGNTVGFQPELYHKASTPKRGGRIDSV